jgi:hypothetical protein
MKISQRKNRKTKGIVELHVERERYAHAAWIDWYWCRCVLHNCDEVFKHSRKSDAIRNMAHPDEWCKECEKMLRVL